MKLKLYQYSVNNGNIDADIDGAIRYILAYNINDACIKIRNNLIEMYRSDFYKIVDAFEAMYGIRNDNDDYHVPYISITVKEEGIPTGIDIAYLESKLQELSNAKNGYDADVSSIVKDLVLNIEYELVLFRNHNIVRRYEILYTGYDINIDAYRRELSDYSPREKNKFEFLSKVKIKGLDNGIVYTVTSTPIHNFYAEYWENIYGVTPVGFEQYPGYEIEVHESELEKVEEE